MARVLGVLLLASLTAGAPAGLTEPQVRAFASRQSADWNAGRFAAYFASFASTARFTDQALANSNTIVPYGSSSREEARAQVGRRFAKQRPSESLTITRVTLAADGSTARVDAQVVSQSGGRTFCAQRAETLARTPRGPRATSQTDTIVRCRAGRVR